MDDGPYVVNNPHIKYGFAPEAIGWAFTSYDLANWHPVTWFSHILDYRMFQLDLGPDTVTEPDAWYYQRRKSRKGGRIHVNRLGIR